MTPTGREETKLQAGEFSAQDRKEIDRDIIIHNCLERRAKQWLFPTTDKRCRLKADRHAAWNVNRRSERHLRCHLLWYLKHWTVQWVLESYSAFSTRVDRLARSGKLFGTCPVSGDTNGRPNSGHLQHSRSSPAEELGGAKVGILPNWTSPRDASRRLTERSLVRVV